MFLKEFKWNSFPTKILPCVSFEFVLGENGKSKKSHKECKNLMNHGSFLLKF